MMRLDSPLDVESPDDPAPARVSVEAMHAVSPETEELVDEVLRYARERMLFADGRVTRSRHTTTGTHRERPG